MKTLLVFFSWRHNRRHLVRLLLGLFSIMLGVALFVSMQVSRISTVNAFEAAARKAAGRAEYSITFRRRIGVDERALRLAESVPGVVATPSLKVSTTFPELPEGAVLILGIDFTREPAFRDFTGTGGGRFAFVRFLTEPDAVILTTRFADRNEIRLGDRFRFNTPGGEHWVHVVGLVADRGPASVFGGNLAVMRVDTVQRLFDKAGFFDRIDVAAAGGGRLGEPVLARLRATLGDAYRVERLRARSGMLDLVLSRLRSLVAVSVIALLVGLFIIYLSVSIGVVERSREIGTLRALGASRGQVQALLLAEAGLLGALGSVLGVGFGYLLSRVLIELTVSSVNILSYVVDVERVVLPPGVAVSGLVAGTVTALAAAWFPARRATRISPLEALRPAIRGFRMAPDYRLGFWVGSVVVVVGFAGVVYVYQELPPDLGLGLTAAVFLGLALALPQVTIWIARLLRPGLRSVLRIEGDLAADNVLQYPQRTALTVTALGGALAMMVATASTITAFHDSLTDWMKRTFPWDLSVWPASTSFSTYSDDPLPRDLVGELARMPGVKQTYGLRVRLQSFGDTEVLLMGLDIRAFLEARARRGVVEDEVIHAPAELAAFDRGEIVGVSKNLAVLKGLDVGDAIELETRSGPKPFRIGFTMEEYSYPAGSIIMNLDVYARWWKDRSLSYIDVVLADGQDVNEAVARIGQKVSEDLGAMVLTVADVVAFGQEALRQSFRLTYVQVIISMVIGFFGIVNTLLISVLHRTREIGLLRSVGMTRRQVARTVVVEALFIAAVGGIFGVIWGLTAAAFPVASHIMRVSGYVIPFVIPWATVVGALITGLVIGFVASLVPAYRAARLNVLEAVGYE